jgi:uncharacterized membrane protein YphA (DoxX/SURF4 family)
VSPRLSVMARLDRTGIPLLLARLFVGGMFAYLALLKLRDPINFLKLSHQYGILPDSLPILLNLTAVVVPWLELICALALLLGLTTRGAGLVAVALLLFFTPMLGLHAWKLYADPARHFAAFCAVKFDCGCGTGEVFICRKLTENIALLLAALIPLFSASRRFCLDALLARRTEQPLAAAVAGTGK